MYFRRPIHHTWFSFLNKALKFTSKIISLGSYMEKHSSFLTRWHQQRWITSLQSNWDRSLFFYFTTGMLSTKNPHGLRLWNPAPNQIVLWIYVQHYKWLLSTLGLCWVTAPSNSSPSFSYRALWLMPSVREVHHTDKPNPTYLGKTIQQLRSWLLSFIPLPREALFLCSGLRLGHDANFLPLTYPNFVRKDPSLIPS